MSTREIGEINVTELPDGPVLIERVRNGLAIPAKDRAAVALALLGIDRPSEDVANAIAAVIAYVDKADEGEAAYYMGAIDFPSYSLVYDLARAFGKEPH